MLESSGVSAEFRPTKINQRNAVTLKEWRICLCIMMLGKDGEEDPQGLDFLYMLGIFVIDTS